MHDGALALEFGWDPINYLSLEGVDQLVGKAILQEAVDRRADNENRHWKLMQSAVQNGVAKAFGGTK